MIGGEGSRIDTVDNPTPLLFEDLVLTGAVGFLVWVGVRLTRRPPRSVAVSAILTALVAGDGVLLFTFMGVGLDLARSTVLGGASAIAVVLLEMISGRVRADVIGWRAAPGDPPAQA